MQVHLQAITPTPCFTDIIGFAAWVVQPATDFSRGLLLPIPAFELKPLEVLVGREAASDIYRLLPTTRRHRALHDATALMEACRVLFSKLELSGGGIPTLSYAKAMSSLSFVEAQPECSLEPKATDYAAG